MERIRGAEKVGLFTTEAHPPAAVARAMLDRGLDYFTGYVCENLGSPDERVTQGELRELADQAFAPLNVMILVRKPNVPDRPREAIGRRLFGNPDDAFLQSKPKRGLLTPAEIRAMALAEMDLGPASIVWDIGAGSGSVAVEAAQIAREGRVYAVEMDVEDHRLIIENAKRFGVGNLVPVLGHAPEAWQDLPTPDAVFIGGSGQGISRLVDAAYGRLRPGGRLVATMQQHRQPGRDAPHAPRPLPGGESLDAEPRPRQLPDGAVAFRGHESRVLGGGGEEVSTIRMDDLQLDVLAPSGPTPTTSKSPAAARWPSLPSRAIAWASST